MGAPKSPDSNRAAKPSSAARSASTVATARLYAGALNGAGLSAASNMTLSRA